MMILGLLAAIGLIMMIVGNTADNDVIFTIGAIMFILGLLTLVIWNIAIFVMQFQ